MTIIHADKVDIDIEPTRWRLFEEQTSLYNIGAAFEFVRGENVLRYRAAFGQKIGLPGDRLALDYVTAVAVGYQDSARRWILGLETSVQGGQKPTFHPLVRWPSADSDDHSQDVRRAAQNLAVFLACPLKIKGEKKLPPATADLARTGYTGPLQPHTRRRIEGRELTTIVRDLELPITAQNFSLSAGRNGLILKLDKALNSTFNLCEINSRQQRVKLVPPTGLLGSLVRPASQEIPFERVANVEHRSVQMEVPHPTKAEDGSVQEELMLQYTWAVYLTLRDKSQRLFQVRYTQTTNLQQQRISVVGGDKFSTNSLEGVQYFRKHVAEQEAIDVLRQSTEHAAYLIADAIDCPVIMTEVEAM